jgi:hypothetical protein
MPDVTRMSSRLLALIVAAAVLLVVAMVTLAPRFMEPRLLPPVPVPTTDIPRITAPAIEDPEDDLPLEGPGWHLIDRLSGHYVLIVKVETDRIEEAEAIARELVEPVRASYVEVLVYFYRPATKRVLASARVQWTPQRGFVTINYEQE